MLKFEAMDVFTLIKDNLRKFKLSVYQKEQAGSL